MVSKVFLTPIPEPHSQGLRNLLTLIQSESLVKVNGTLALSPTRLIIVCIPVRSRQSDTPVHFLDERFTLKRSAKLFLDILFRRHVSDAAHVNEQWSMVKGAKHH